MELWSDGRGLSQRLLRSITPPLHLSNPPASSCLRPDTVAACRSPHPKGRRRPRLSWKLSCLRPDTVAACRSPHPKGWRRPRLHHSIFHASAPVPLRPAAHRIPRGGGGPDSIIPSFMPPPRCR